MIAKKSMKGKIFLDTNVLLYAFGKEKAKKNVAKKIIFLQPLISSQVVNEVLNVLLRKFGFTVAEAREAFELLQSVCRVEQIGTATIDSALTIRDRYLFSYWDSLIVASALEQGCTTLYSEDMQHGQVLEKKLKIINPFIE